MIIGRVHSKQREGEILDQTIDLGFDDFDKSTIEATRLFESLFNEYTPWIKNSPEAIQALLKDLPEIRNYIKWADAQLDQWEQNERDAEEGECISEGLTWAENDEVISARINREVGIAWEKYRASEEWPTWETYKASNPTDVAESRPFTSVAKSDELETEKGFGPDTPIPYRISDEFIRNNQREWDILLKRANDAINKINKP